MAPDYCPHSTDSLGGQARDVISNHLRTKIITEYVNPNMNTPGHLPRTIQGVWAALVESCVVKASCVVSVEPERNSDRERGPFGGESTLLEMVGASWDLAVMRTTWFLLSSCWTALAIIQTSTPFLSWEAPNPPARRSPKKKAVRAVWGTNDTWCRNFAHWTSSWSREPLCTGPVERW